MSAAFTPSASPRRVLIALTGLSRPQDRRRAAEAGFDANLVEPADPGQLQGLLADLQPAVG
jgi:CheY-like chemotaxis protein